MAQFTIDIPDHLVPRVLAAAGKIWPLEGKTNSDAINIIVRNLIMNIVQDMESRKVEQETAEKMRVANLTIDEERRRRLEEIKNEIGVLG